MILNLNRDISTMLFNFFTRRTLVSLCIKIINSVVVVGFYYGFMTTLSIGSSYIFLLRAWIIAEEEEQKLSATTGFIMGQFMIFMSIYYAPLHIALGRSYTLLTVLVLPYLLFDFFSDKTLFDYGSTTRMRNLSIPWIYLNYLIFQLCPHFILPWSSSMLFRLGNVYMFRCNNKALFLTSNFAGWLIGFFLFMKWVGLGVVWIDQNVSRRLIRSNMKRIELVLVGIQQNASIRIRSNPLIRSNMKWVGLVLVWIQQNVSIKPNRYVVREFKYIVSDFKYLVSELINSMYMARFFRILVLATSFFYLAKIGSPYANDKLSLSPVFGRDLVIHNLSDPCYGRGWVGDKYKMTYRGGENRQNSRFFHLFEKPIITLFFNYKRWHRPLRYMETNEYSYAVRDEASQYYFHICTSDGKERISFTHPPSLVNFFNMMERGFFCFAETRRVNDEKILIKSDPFKDPLTQFGHWVFVSAKKERDLSVEFRNRIAALSKGSISAVEKRPRFCINDTNKEYVPKKYDPLFYGPRRQFSVISSDSEKNPGYPLLMTEKEQEEAYQQTPKEKINDLLDVEVKWNDVMFILANIGNYYQDPWEFNAARDKIVRSVRPKRNRRSRYDCDLQDIYDYLFHNALSPLCRYRNKIRRLREAKERIAKRVMRRLAERINKRVAKVFGTEIRMSVAVAGLKKKEVRVPPFRMFEKELKKEMTFRKVRTWVSDLKKKAREKMRKMADEKMRKMADEKMRKMADEKVRTGVYALKKEVLEKVRTGMYALKKKVRTGMYALKKKVRTGMYALKKKVRKKMTDKKVRTGMYALKKKVRKKMTDKKVRTGMYALKKKVRKKMTDKPNSYMDPILAQQIGTFVINQRAEMRKKVPRWLHQLVDEFELANGYENTIQGDDEDFDIHSARARAVIVVLESQLDLFNPTKQTLRIFDEKVQEEETYLLEFLDLEDFRRCIIRGSMRPQRRKTSILSLWVPRAHSPTVLVRENLFLKRYKHLSALLKSFFGMWKNKKFKNSTNTKFIDFRTQLQNYIQNFIKRFKKEKEKKKKDIDRRESKAEEEVQKILDVTDNFILAQPTRCFVLLGHAILRKYIILPSLIIVKNIVRMLLFQVPEWSEDFKDWNKETQMICTYNGIHVSEYNFPYNWSIEGMQIKILLPFYLQPWHDSKLQEEKPSEFFLTVFGDETDIPYGPGLAGRRFRLFFKPIFTELETKIRKWKTMFFLVRTGLKELSKKNSKRYELSGTKKQKDSIISNPMIHESSIQVQSIDLTNSSEIELEKKMKDLTERINTIRNQLKKTTKDKKKGFLTSKEIWQILKRGNARLSRKFYLYYSFRFCIESIYKSIYINIFLYHINIFPYIINISRIHAQLFVKSTKKMIDKYIYNNEVNQKKKKKKSHFISTIKKSPWKVSISKKSSQPFVDLSPLSQAYVFYKLSQTQVINLSKLRFVFQYLGTSVFLKNEIKDFFGEQGIFHSELKHKNLRNSETNQWKNWLRGHGLRGNYQYHLSKIRWSRLVPQKWRNRVNQRRMAKNKDLNKWDSYKKNKNRLIRYEKQNSFEPDLLFNQKSYVKKQKHYRYNLLSYKSINSQDNKDSCIYGSSLQLNNKQVDEEIVDIERIPVRKYYDWRILDFDLLTKTEIASWVNDIESWGWVKTDTNNNNKSTCAWADNYRIFEKREGLFYVTSYQDGKINPSSRKRFFFDWNEEIPIENPDLSFGPEFGPLYNAYNRKPWIIPIQLLFLNFKKRKVTQNIAGKIKESIMDLGSDAQNQASLGSFSSRHKKVRKENKWESGLEESKDKDQSITLDDGYGNWRLENYLEAYRFNVLLHLNEFLPDNFLRKLVENVRKLCIVKTSKNVREVLVKYTRREQIHLDFLLNESDLLMGTGVPRPFLFSLEPSCGPILNDGQFIIYQILNISLVHKSKHQMNKKDRIGKKNLDESIARHQKIAGNRDSDHYDLLVPENVFSPRRRREMRIQLLLCEFFNEIYGKRFPNNVKNGGQVLDKSNHLYRDKNRVIKLKHFLWPNYRLEDLACMNRYWFDTNNGSRFSLIRIHMYPRLKFRWILDFLIKLGVHKEI